MYVNINTRQLHRAGKWYHDTISQGLVQFDEVGTLIAYHFIFPDGSKGLILNGETREAILTALRTRSDKELKALRYQVAFDMANRIFEKLHAEDIQRNPNFNPNESPEDFAKAIIEAGLIPENEDPLFTYIFNTYVIYEQGVGYTYDGGQSYYHDRDDTIVALVEVLLESYRAQVASYPPPGIGVDS